jgi:hypothetical protein
MRLSRCIGLVPGLNGIAVKIAPTLDDMLFDTARLGAVNLCYVWWLAFSAIFSGLSTSYTDDGITQEYSLLLLTLMLG